MAWGGPTFARGRALWSGSGGGYFLTKAEAKKSALDYGRERGLDEVFIYQQGKPGTHTTVKVPKRANPSRTYRAAGRAGKVTRARARRNPDSAAALTEEFHGRPVDKITDVIEEEVYRAKLADLGQLIQLVVTDDNEEITLDFTGDIRVAAAPNGGQLYFLGGDQRLDLDELGLSEYLPKDTVFIGDVCSITYYTSKDFHNFEPIDYVHEFGEDDEAEGREPELPVLLYDVLNQTLKLAGGSYIVKREGIRN